jgi:hypothetical protein
MGMFTKGQKNLATSTYLETKKYLKPQDGKIHVVMINSFSKWLNQIFGCEDKYTTQIDEIISCMQEDGYEIVDVKFNSIQGQGMSKDLEGFHTLIIYK